MPSAIGHFERIRALAGGPRLLALGGTRASNASSIVLFDHVASTVTRTLELPTHVLAMAFAGEQLLAAGADGSVYQVDVSGKKPPRAHEAHQGAVTSLAVSSTHFATAGVDGTARLFDLSGKLVDTLSCSSRPLRAVALDPAGQSLAAAGDDGVVRVFSLGNRAVREMPGHDGPVRALVFTPKDGRLVSGGEDGTVRIWFLVGNVEADVRGKDESGHVGGVTALAFIPARRDEDVGERLVSVGADGKARVFRLGERRKPRTFELSTEALCAATFVPASSTSGAFSTLFAAGDARTVFAIAGDDKATPLDTVNRFAHGFDVLAESLSASARSKRESAIRQLLSLAEDDAEKLLLRALQSDKEPELRALVASELCRIVRRNAGPALRARLDDGHSVVRLAALQALRALETDEPLAALRAGLGSQYPDVRATALGGLFTLAERSPLATGLIASKLTDDHADVRRVALDRLIALHPTGDATPLRTAFERGPADVRAEVVVRVVLEGLMQDADIANLLDRALDDADPNVRRLALIALVLGKPRLAAWMEGADEAFGRALVDLLRRALIVHGTAADPSPAQIDELRALVKKALAPAAGTALDESARQPLLSALACRSPDTALRGARTLAMLGDLRALGALLTISRETDPDLRRGAALALAALDDPRAQKRLVWMLNDTETSVRDAVFGCLDHLATSQLDLAESALRSAREDIRVRGLDVLVKQGTKGSERAQSLLSDSLEDEAEKVRGEAFRTFWAWHGEDPLVAIDRALTARFPDLRIRAVTELVALAKPKGPAAGSALERLYKTIADRDAAVATAAYEALVELEGKETPRAHVAGMDTLHPSLRILAAKKGSHAPVESVRSALVKQLQDEHQPARTQALETLDELLPKESGPLYAAIQSSFIDLRVRAAELLADRRDEQLIDAMRGLLSDRELARRLPPEILVPLRRRAATALASLGSARVLKYFATELLKDEDPIVQEQAARGLANATRHGEEGHLLDALGHPELAVRSWAAEGLARLGDVRALPVLTGTLHHQHPPIRVGAILSFAALGPEGFGGLLQGLEDASREVQHVVLQIVLSRDLGAFRRGEPPDLLTSALSSQRPEIRFAAARALELRVDPGTYLAHLVELLLPPKPEKAADMQRWPSEEQRARWMIGLAEVLASGNSEQRYAAAQVLRLRDRPLDFFREVERLLRPRGADRPWIPETTPREPPPSPEKAPKASLALLRKLFANGTTNGTPQKTSEVPEPEQQRLRLVAFGAYVGLLRQNSTDDEAHRVRRDTIDRMVTLVSQGTVPAASATPVLTRALDDPHHLVRRAAFAALKQLYANEPTVALGLALDAQASDTVRTALDELAKGGEEARASLVRALDSRVPEARRHAFELLEQLGPKGSVEPLLAALGSSHSDIRIGVLERLSSSQDPRVTTALGRALESDHEDLRIRAAELLAARADERCLDVLSGLLRAPEATVANRARTALARLGTPAAVRVLRKRLDETLAEDERRALVSTLAQLPRAESVDALISCLSDDVAAIRTAAFEACRSIVGPRSEAPREPWSNPPKPRNMELAATFLAAAARSRHADIRQLSTTELDDLAHASADSLLVGLFSDRFTEVRAAAVAAYAKRVARHGASIEPLEEVLRAGVRETMLAAAEGLAIHKAPAAFRALLLYVRAGQGDEPVRALLSLGTLGDTRALAELETIADGGTEDAPVEIPMQAAALEALGRLFPSLTDPEARERVIDRLETKLSAPNLDFVVAAVRGLRHVGGERARARLCSVLDSSSSHATTQRAVIEALGELGDVESERSLAMALDHRNDAIRWAARQALDRLFPDQRARVELLALGSTRRGVAEAAASYLAAEGNPADVLARLGSVRDPELRERLRLGLSRRPTLPSATLVSLLRDESPLARTDAAFVLGMRAGTETDTATIGRELTEAARLAESRHRTRQAAGDGEAEQHERKAWATTLWALRRLAPTTAAETAKGWIGGTEIPTDIQAQSILALAAHQASTPEIVAALARAMGHGEPLLRSLAAAVGARLGVPVEKLDTSLDAVRASQVMATAKVSADALGSMAGRQIHLARVLRERDASQLSSVAREAQGADRDAVVSALGRIATPAATEVLRALAFDKKLPLETRKQAYRALRRAQRLATRKAPAEETAS